MVPRSRVIVKHKISHIAVSVVGVVSSVGTDVSATDSDWFSIELKDFVRDTSL